MITSRHLVICLYIAEICCICVVVFSKFFAEYAEEKEKNVCRRLYILLLIRLIVKMIYFYVEYYIETWPLSFLINVAMDSTYVLSILFSMDVVREMSGIHFRYEKILSRTAAVLFVLGFEVISFFWIDRASNVDIIFEKNIAKVLYFANETFFLSVLLIFCFCYLVTIQKKKEAQKEKRKCQYVLWNNVWYVIYVYLWNISFVIPNGKKIRSLKPLDGILLYILILILLEVYCFWKEYQTDRDFQEKEEEESREDQLEVLVLEKQLTKRETEIFYLLYQGASYAEISEKLVISVNTVKRHCSNIYQKLEIKNRNQIPMLAEKKKSVIIGNNTKG